MEQNGISTIMSPSENSVGKSKSIGITLRSSSSFQSAKEKLKAPCEYKLIVQLQSNRFENVQILIETHISRKSNANKK